MFTAGSRRLERARWYALVMAALLGACGGGGGPWSGGDGASGPPGAPVGLAANAGDGVVSLGWAAPATGTGPFVYAISISPATTQASVTQSGTTALVRGLSNGSTYTFSVTASTNAGKSGAASIQARPLATDNTNYTALTIQGDNSPSGILDPAPLRATNAGTLWLAYTGANYYNAAGTPILDLSTRLARSDDGGATFSFVRELGTAQPAAVTDTLGTVCGGICSGRWVYAEPWLVEDSGDPDPARRFKLFAHKYFLAPGAATPQQFQLGSIVMWTASTPDANWSTEQSLLGWNHTPPELAPLNNFNLIDPTLSQCLTAAEGSATINAGALDFVFVCRTSALNPQTQKIVLLRSLDHALSFKYISTPLAAADAARLGASYLAAPALLPSPTNAPVLIATPVTIDNFGISNPLGCRVLPIADAQTGALYRDAGSTPIEILRVLPPVNTLGGGCGWDRGLGSTGLLMNDFVQPQTGPFGVLQTNRPL